MGRKAKEQHVIDFDEEPGKGTLYTPTQIRQFFDMSLAEYLELPEDIRDRLEVETDWMPLALRHLKALQKKDALR